MRMRTLAALVFGLGVCSCGVEGITQQRCEALCERQNNDPQCPPVENCPQLCNAVLSAAERCQTQILAFWDCAEAAEDLCTDPPSSVCSAEASEYSACIVE